MKGAFADAKVGFMGARVTEPAPSWEALQRLLKAPQRTVEGLTRVSETRGGAAPGGTKAPVASERVGWWRRMFGG